MEKENSKFNVKKITLLQDIIHGNVKEIKESDLTIQTDSHLIQFEYKEVEDSRPKYKIKPGCFSMSNTNMGVILEKFKLKEYNLLKTIDNTSTIINEKNKFFDKLDVYKELKKDPKRAILLCSPPGVGKSSAINEVCKNLLKDEGTVVIIWDTSSLNASDVNKFFLNRSVFDEKVKRMAIIIEDIEGGTLDEDEYRPRSSGSSMLNFLDGVGNPFKGVPTFIIATTNNPEKSVGALIDRPGRFDKVIEMKTPNKKESKELLAFILDRKLEEKEEASAEKASENEFSIAHLQEAVVRSKIDDISVCEAIDQLISHKKRFKEAFAKSPKRSLGLGR